MKNVANAPIIPATTTSIAMMPMFVAIASGESLLPKHTGQANAARGAATRPRVMKVFRISFRSAAAVALQQLFGLALERSAVRDQPAAGRQRQRGSHQVADAVRGLVLLRGPCRHEGRKDH